MRGLQRAGWGAEMYLQTPQPTPSSGLYVHLSTLGRKLLFLIQPVQQHNQLGKYAKIPKVPKVRWAQLCGPTSDYILKVNYKRIALVSFRLDNISH